MSQPVCERHRKGIWRWSGSITLAAFLFHGKFCREKKCTAEEAFRDQYSILSERINKGILISPINGIVNNPSAIDTILSIQDTTQCIALFPILWKYAGFINKGQEVHIRIPGEGIWTGFVRLIDNNVQVISGDARVIITVELEEEYSNINVGQVVEGKIKFKSTTILSKISRFVKNTIDFRA